MAALAFDRLPSDAHDFRSFSQSTAAIAAPPPPSRRRLHAAAIDRCHFASPALQSSAIPADNPIKRLADLLIATLLIVMLSPAMMLIACLVRLDGGPVLFGHRRVGASGDVFRCWKFRTMVVDADTVLTRLLESDPQARAEWQRDFKLRCDPRITRIGHFLRVTSLDELPQLLNVLKGEMSLVGPRPIVADEIRRYGAAFHDYARCRPGITGIWQISGRNDVDYGARVQLDQDYARRWSLRHDCRILLKTPAAVLHKNGAY